MKPYITAIFLIFPITIFAQVEPVKQNNSIKNIRRNLIYLELGGNLIFWSAINYDRLIPFSNNMGTILRFGMSDTGACGDLNILIGKHKHFLETGAGYSQSFTNDQEEDDYPRIPMRIGYRYQAAKGFTFRAAPMLIYDLEASNEPIDAWFGLSVGYSF